MTQSSQVGKWANSVCRPSCGLLGHLYKNTVLCDFYTDRVSDCAKFLSLCNNRDWITISRVFCSTLALQLKLKTITIICKFYCFTVLLRKLVQHAATSKTQLQLYLKGWNVTLFFIYAMICFWKHYTQIVRVIILY